jgi:hypothetical protein
METKRKRKRRLRQEGKKGRKWKSKREGRM